jgi:squalene-hopene/tetraprenyl-beta-curcumene cyclase
VDDAAQLSGTSHGKPSSPGTNRTATSGRTVLLEALRRAQDHLVGLQDTEGWWKGELETNVTIDAEDLMLRHFLGILEPATAKAAARWIGNNQRPDGTWGTFFGAPADLSATVEAYVALRLAGEAANEPRLAGAAAWVRANGGVEATRVFTRIWLAMVGEWDWEDLPDIPSEIMLLPTSVPLNIYDFACWARQTIVALSVLYGHRPSRPLPFGIDELRADPETVVSGPAARAALHPAVEHRAIGWRALGDLTGRFELLDDALHRYEHLPAWVVPKQRIRHESMNLAEQWIVRRQEADGGWGGIQAPLVYSVVALSLQGYALHHPVMQAALAGIDSLVIEDDLGRRVEACQSPVWDTALAVIALAESGMPPGNPALAAASDWLVGNEVRAVGDWSVRRPGLEPGGWAFEFANDNYPDIDDTAEVVLALRKAGGAQSDAGDDAVRRAVTWVVGMQSRAGGWGAFDADNTSELAAALPFSDFGAVTDPPSADVTAHVIEMLAGEPGVPGGVVAHAVKWLSAQQESDGSWYGRWGVNYVYGTGAVIPALVAAGVDAADSRVRRAVSWLEQHQNADGGWGEDIRSYIDVSYHGRGESTASQTAWALLALIAAGDHDGDATRRGVQYLISTQTDDGTWDEPWFTGTGFPWDFSINYHLYRLVWPIMALGRYAALEAT